MWTKTWEDMTAQMKSLNDNIKDQETKRKNTINVIDTTTEMLALEIITRDNCLGIWKTAASTLETKTNDFELRQRVRYNLFYKFCLFLIEWDN